MGIIACWIEWETGSVEMPGFLFGLLLLAGGIVPIIMKREAVARNPIPFVILLLMAAHVLVANSGGADSALYSFYFVPILFAARSRGTIGAGLTGLAVLVLYGSFFRDASPDEIQSELIEEFITICFVSLLSGILVDRIANEQQLRREAERREEENRAMAEMGVMVSQIAHEMRNPLQIITSAAQTILRKGWIVEPGREFLNDVERECVRMSRLVNDFLVYGRLKVEPNEEVDIGEICRDAAKRYPGCIVRVEGECGRMRGDPEALRLLFLNLVGNSVQHGARKITIRCSCGKDGLGDVIFSDDGEGVDLKVVPQLFRPFRSGRPGGTGLGLAIVKRIVNAHGGEVTFEGAGEGGKGAVFRLRFPCE
ncbi:MAG: sensor histidine kinase [Candidatus Hydrogenedentota bacterium]|nr:MAG: sensor histidine kinase [Candidatus Hydrogenedentota bacterium]